MPRSLGGDTDFSDDRLPHSSVRDSDGISKLPQIQLILPYTISCIRVSSEIPLLSLGNCRILKEIHTDLTEYGQS